MKFKFKLLIILASVAVAVGILILIFPQCAEAVWHNATAWMWDKKIPEDAWTDGDELLNIPYASDSESQYLDLYLPKTDEKVPLFVLVHGGGFVFGDSQTKQVQWMYRYFRDKGYACASINYRLAQEAQWPASVEDTKAAIRFLRANADKYGIDADHVAIWGESAGGYIACMVAVTQDGQLDSVKYIGQTDDSISAQVNVLVDYYGVIDFGCMSDDFAQERIPLWVYRLANSGMKVSEMADSGYKSLEDYYIGNYTAQMSEEELAPYSARSYIAALDPDALKTVIVHGDTDITVPVLQSKRLEAELSAHMGEESVTAIYPHGCRHADDRLYSDSILEEIENYIHPFLFD